MVASSILHVVSWNDDLDHRLAPIAHAGMASGNSVLGLAGPDADPGAWPDLTDTAMTWIHAPTVATARSFRNDVKALVPVLDRYSPTVVHIHAGPLAAAAMVAARQAGVGRRVYSAAGFEHPDHRGGAGRATCLIVERFVASGVHAVLASSLSEEERFVHTLRIPKARVSMVGRGVDLKLFAPGASLGQARANEPSRTARRARWGASEGDFVCGVVGEGLAEGLQAAVRSSRLEESAPTVHCVELDPAYLLSAPHRAEFFDAVDVVVLAGPTDAAHRTSAVRVTGPSDTALAREIAASAKVAIVQEQPGVHLVIEDARTGYVVLNADVVTEANRIVDLVAHPQRRERMEIAARAKALREFDRQHEVEAVFAAYNLSGETV